MTIHQLQLATVPFDAITSGVKTIESRLYDEKRQTIQLGGESVEWLESQINEFYSIDDQRKDGVIGIEFELI